MNIQVLEEGQKIVITLPEEVDLNFHSSFRSVYVNRPKETEYILDCSQVSMIYSSGMTAFILLREHCGEERAKISLINCNQDVKKSLEVVRFTDIFEVS